MIVILTEIEDSVPYIKDKLKESRWATKRTLIQYRLDKDVLIHQIGDIVVQFGLQEFFNINPDDWYYSVSDYGKPTLIHESTLNFNISYAYPYVVCVFDNRPVGIDIEQMNRVEYDDIITCLHYEEQTFIRQSEEEERAFLEIWTRKESYVKLLGIGLNKDIATYNVISPKTFEQKQCYFHKYEADNYIINVCSQKIVKPRIIILNLKTDILKL